MLRVHPHPSGSWCNDHLVVSSSTVGTTLQPTKLRTRDRPSSVLRFLSTAALHEFAVLQLQSSMINVVTARQPRDLFVPRAEAMALTCSFPSMLHPLYRNVRADCDHWIEVMVRPASSDCSRRMRQRLLPRLACRLMPAAPSRWRLVHAIKMLAWLLIDISDDQSWTQPSYAERILTILQEPADAYDDRRLWNYDLLDDRLPRQLFRRLAALGDLWRQISPDMSPLLRSRFICSMADYVQGMKILLKDDRDADMEHLMAIRRQGSFTTLGLIVLEYAYGADLEEEFILNPRFIELYQKAADYVILCHDIVSFALQGNSSIGLLPDTTTCISHPSPENFTSSMTCLITDTEACCASLMASLKEEYSKPNVDPVQASRVRAHVDAVALAMSGVVAWLLERKIHTETQF